MTALVWDDTGERVYETGVDHGVLYVFNTSTNSYDKGVAWNGITTVTESPGGAEANPQYADNIVYLSLLSAETWEGTIEALTYPDEFGECDGTASPVPGLSLGQQVRKMFGMAWRTKVGDDTDPEAGYKIHLAYGLKASPSEKAHATVNDSPAPVAFSWGISSTPTVVTDYASVATLTLDSTKLDASAMAAAEQLLYGTTGVDAALPFPDEIIALFDDTITVTAVPSAPTYSSGTDLITIPVVTGVVYTIDGAAVSGDVGPIAASKVVNAHPAAGYIFPAVCVDRWLITFA